MPNPACARVVGFWPFTVAAACLSVSLTSARIGSPSGRKSLYAQVSEVIAPLNSSAPHWKVTNGGTAVGVPPLWPDGTSIASSSAAVAARTVIVYGGKDWSKSRESSIWRGWPPVNSGSVNDVPVTFSYFHSLLLESEYSVGLK